MTVYRYTRRLNELSDTAIDDWHEMSDNGPTALCGLTHVASPDSRYQHVVGSAFPQGRVCSACRAAREWLDIEDDGFITDSPDRPRGWP